MLGIFEHDKAQALINCSYTRDDMRRRLVEDHGLNPIWEDYSANDIEQVCLILSSPRSGSSVFVKKLKDLTGVYFLQGEETPFYELCGLNNFPEGELNPEFNDEVHKMYSKELLSDCWKSTAEPIDVTAYQTAIFGRLGFQLPMYENEKLLQIRDAWKIDCLPINKDNVSTELMYAKLFNTILRFTSMFNPYYWDVTQEFVNKNWPCFEPPTCPPDIFLIEEAPFVMADRCAQISYEDLRYKTLLIKNPTNCYRKEFIKKLYPNAEIKVIHLVRNPAATINGLMDGWLHHGFYSFNLKEELNIFGYSEQYKELKLARYTEPLNIWAKHYWNFDMPPNWKELRRENLEKVCAEQWYQAHKVILEDWYDDDDIDHHFVRFEDFICKDFRHKVINGVQTFLDSTMVTHGNDDELPQVMATKHPRPTRWRDRETRILDCLARNPHIEQMANQLGYGEIDTWI